MSDSLLFGPTLRATQTALDGLVRRQQVISQNLANIDTPDYKAQTVTFEEAMQHATDKPQSTGLQLTLTHANHLAPKGEQTQIIQTSLRAGGSVRSDGNNVDVDQELMELSETSIRFQAVAQFASKKLMGLKSIATGR